MTLHAVTELYPESPDEAAQPHYGLQRHVLGPLETLAQSISTMAPTCTPAMTVPLVFATAGNGTWLSYLMALVCTLLIGLCIARFAQHSASPGSLYVYTATSLPPVLAGTAAWALLIAYIATGASVVGGFAHYANVVLLEFFSITISPVLLAAIAAISSIWIAYRDVRISARLMVYIEVASVLLIAVLFAVVLWQHGLHLDLPQLSLRGANFSGVRLGVVLAMFSFVGFESATTLGEEARHPLENIPRAVILSAVLAGAFFIAASYSEVLGYPASASVHLDASTAPLNAIANAAHIARLAPVLDLAATISMFACTLACVTAAARVLFLMAHNGLVHRAIRATHKRNETPHAAVLVTGVITLVLPAALAAFGVEGESIYGWMGSLATYGFITVYALVAIALPLHLHRERNLSPWSIALAVSSVLAMLAILAGTLYPVPAAPYNWLPYLYLFLLLLGVGWHYLQPRSADSSRA